jgi:hypothetical protein
MIAISGKDSPVFSSAGEHRRAKTDRLDTELLMRAFLGWLRGQKRHCSIVAIPVHPNLQ